MSESRSRVTLGLVKELAVPVLLGATFMNNAIRSVNTSDGKTVPEPYQPVPTLMKYGAKDAVERDKLDNREKIESDRELLNAFIISDPKMIAAARQIEEKEMHKMTVVFSVKAAGLILTSSHENVAKNTHA